MNIELSADLTFSTEKPEVQFFELNQVHGINLLFSSECHDNNATSNINGDGFIIDLKDKRTFAIKTADCVPLLLRGKTRVALLHVGWRGLKAGIHLQNSVSAIAPTSAVIGPALLPCCYEVQEDFLTNFPQEFFFTKENKHYFQLTKKLTHDLLIYYPNISIYDCALCTCCEPNFHSFREDKTTKRNYTLYRNL